MGATRLASGNYAAIIVVAFVFNFYLYPDAGRVAPISACVWLWRLALASVRMFTLKGARKKVALGGFLPYYNNLHTEYLASYTNTPQLIDYQYFT